MAAEIDVVKGLKAIETLKVDLMKAQCLFNEGTLTGSEPDILRGLAEMVGLSYLLTKRLGYDYARLDRTLLQTLERWQHEEMADLEEQWGDIGMLLTYLVPEE